jgi:hypothetical protein
MTRPTGGVRNEPASSEEGRAMDLLKCYVGMLADQKRVAVKHILLVDQMLKLLRAKPASKEELVATGVMSPQAVELVGSELVEFLHGRIALSIDVDRVLIKNLGAKSVDGKSSEL